MKKECLRCKEIKDLSEYNKCSRYSDGLAVYCKSCRKTYYNKNKEQIKQKAKDNYYKRKDDPILEKTARISCEEIQKRIDEIHDGKIKIIPESYVNTQEKAKFIDVDYGEFEYSVYHILNGCYGHPKRKDEEKKKTFLREFGVDNPLKDPMVREKIIETNKRLYGVENPAQSSEIQERTKKTNIEKFGVDNPMKNHEIALKSARSANKSVVLKNWKTGEEQVCIGSYEEKTVNNLNESKTEYKWQPKTFTMPDGRTYRPDLYLIKERKWIEIKGYFYDDAEEKWNWFHETYPNSELWNEKKLKEMRIL